MNYRHAFHAGNFADVLKHATLALIIEHLKRKPKPFRVIDTHAGAGVYPLLTGAAERTGEWREGIANLIGEGASPLPEPIAETLAPYLATIRAENLPGRLERYPGSPVIARRLMRREDRLVLNELNAGEREQLKARFARDRQVTLLDLDGYTALRSTLPPPERRGLLLIDPPFEVAGEFDRLVEALAEAHRRFASGTVMIWYPIKDARAAARFLRRLRGLALPKLLAVELRLIARPLDTRLPGAGLVLLNPPYTLESELARLLPFLATRLAQGPGAGSSLEWLGPP